MLGRFNEAAGVRVRTRSERPGPCQVRLPDGATARFAAAVRYEMDLTARNLWVAEEDGRPFSEKPLGQGECSSCAHRGDGGRRHGGAFEEGGQPLWQFYRAFAEKALAARTLRKTNPWLGVTEHPTGDGGLIWVFVNYSRLPAEDELTLPEDFN